MRILLLVFFLFAINVFGQILDVKVLETSIISETGADYFLANPNCLSVDKQKNIIVFDEGEYNFKVFNSELKHIKTFSRKGKGPGEIKGYYFIIEEINDGYLISDFFGHTVHKFSQNFQFISSKSIELEDFWIENMTHNKKSELFIVKHVKLDKYSQSGELLKSLELDCPEVEKNGCMTMRQKYLFNYEGKLVLVYNDKYLINFRDYELNLLENLEDENYKRREFSDEEIKKYNGLVSKDSFPSIFENVLLLKDYLILYFRPRSHNKYQHKIDIWNLKTKKKLFSDSDKSFKVFKDAKAFSENEIIAIKKNNEGLKEVKKYKVDFN